NHVYLPAFSYKYISAFKYPQERDVGWKEWRILHNFQGKCVIYAETQFDAESFKNACPDIYHQIEMLDWGPFTIPIDPYFLELEVYVTPEAINTLWLDEPPHRIHFSAVKVKTRQTNSNG
ncbi:hypothetical protein HAX54_050697, partial [Datura stramonium]|nr:hypothetical protein [Datura stramonium]